MIIVWRDSFNDTRFWPCKRVVRNSLLSGSVVCQLIHFVSDITFISLNIYFLYQLVQAHVEKKRPLNKIIQHTHTWSADRLPEKPSTASGYSLKNHGTKRFSSSGSSDGRRHASPRWWRSSIICRNMFSSRMMSSHRHLFWWVNKKVNCQRFYTL